MSREYLWAEKDINRTSGKTFREIEASDSGRWRLRRQCEVKHQGNDDHDLDILVDGRRELGGTDLGFTP